MAYIIQRTTGKHVDYLYEWDDEWGTSCRVSRLNAMRFGTLEEAQKAADRAQTTCLNVDREPTKICKFLPVQEII